MYIVLLTITAVTPHTSFIHAVCTLLCYVTVLCDCVMWLYYVTVLYDCVMWLCYVTVLCDCVMWLRYVTVICDCVMWLCYVTVLCDCVIRVTQGILSESLLHWGIYVLYIRKGVLVRQRLIAMTSSVLLIRNVGTWKIVITVLTALNRQRLRAPPCELVQAGTGSEQLMASNCCLKLRCGLLQRVQALREARPVGCQARDRLLRYHPQEQK